MDGSDVHLDLYIRDLIDEMVGAEVTFPELADYGKYISIINILQYMAAHKCSHQAWKRRVLKMMGMLNEMGRQSHHV